MGRVVTGIGSAVDGKRTELLALHDRDRFARFGAEYAEAVLAAQGRKLLVVDPAEVNEALVGDFTQIMTSLCALLYGRRPAADRARRAVEPMERAGS